MADPSSSSQPASAPPGSSTAASSPPQPSSAPQPLQQQQPPDTQQSNTNSSTTNSQPLAATPRRTSRVHWDGSSNAASFRRGQLQLGQATGVAGPTVTARGGANPSAGLTLSSVQRANHPGPLNLAERLTPMNENQEPALPDSAQSNNDSDLPRPQVPTLSLTGAKGLDEQGLDNRAFLELQRELQRHESRTENAESPTSWPGAAPLNGTDNNPDAGPQRNALEQALMERERDRQARRRKQAALLAEASGGPGFSNATSGASTPGWTSESSYDPANDSDLDHLDMIPGETDGMPARIKKSAEEDKEEQPKGWAKLRSMFGKSQQEDELDETEKGPVDYEEGGPTNRKAVPVETSSGLHTEDGPRRRPSKFEREAARLVKQHKLTQMRSSALNRINRSHLPGTGASTPDPLETSMQMDARPVAAGGILGNLLMLYEQQQKERMMSGMTSVAGTSSVGSISEVPDHDGEVSELTDNMKNVAAAQAAADDSSSTGAYVDQKGNIRRRGWQRSGMPSPHIGQTFAKAGGTVLSASSKVVKGVASEAGFEEVIDERPKAARSSAGVFGGLIATTGNLIGAVSPLHAQLGPNPKRPGYTLDRYLLPEMNAKTLKRTAQIVADAAPRPRASGFSSPADTRTHSATGSPRGEQHDGSSTQAGSPSGIQTPKKRPSSLMLMPTRSRHSTDPASAGRKGLHPFSNPLGKSWTGYSLVNTPDVTAHNGNGDYFGPDADHLQKLEWQRKLKKRAKDKKKKEEVFITMHVAAILQRQEFILKLARALMMFGAPTHRIETQIQQTARVLDVNCRCIYLPNLMLLAFGDDTTHTSETKFIKQAGGLDLTKLTDMHSIYWNVIHDKIGVGEASAQLDELMRRKPLIGRLPMVFIGGFASAFICIGPQGFGGSFVDALAAFPLGMFLVYCQSIITTELYSNVFEIVFATLNSFIAAALQYTGYFCYAAVVSGSIVLILPGFIVLSGSLELQAKNLIAGSVRLVYALIYSLFLGFGLSIGTSLWNLVRGTTDSDLPYDKCQHRTDHWYLRDVAEIWALLTTPGYAISLSLRNQVKVNRKEFPVMVLIACAGWASNHFSAKSPALNGRQDMTSALGSLCVGILANIYGRIFDGRSFVVAVPGILYQLPSGLSNGGLLKFADSSSSEATYDSGFNVARSLIEVTIGLTVGLFTSTVLSYMLGGRKVRNGGGLFSF